MQEREKEIKKVLVLGNGGRETAFGWALAKQRDVELTTTLGNAGTAALGKNADIDPEDVEKTAEFASQKGFYLTVVGPEGPLAKGIVNKFKERGLPIFGPTKEAAQLETSKIWAGQFMIRHDIPIPESAFFTDFRSARAYIENYQKRCVIKADGLTGGKGVEVCETKEQALAALEKITNKYGEKVVVQERLYGKEASVFAIVSGETVLTLPPTEDYKQVFDGDKGPMTGGMCGVCPHWEVVNSQELEDIKQRVLIPIVEGMAAEGKPYQGILYAGLIKTEDGYKVLEINARGGDPEMQLILSILKSLLLPVLKSATDGDLDKIVLEYIEKFAVGVVLASEGYPGEPIKGREVLGVPEGVEAEEDILVFQAGTTKNEEDEIITSGGRVLTVVGLGETVDEAGRKAYGKLAAVDDMKEEFILPEKIGILGGGHYRTDAGQRGKPRYTKY